MATRESQANFDIVESAVLNLVTVDITPTVGVQHTTTDGTLMVTHKLIFQFAKGGTGMSTVGDTGSCS